jgi:hypothetical protein
MGQTKHRDRAVNPEVMQAKMLSERAKASWATGNLHDKLGVGEMFCHQSLFTQVVKTPTRRGKTALKILIYNL